MKEITELVQVNLGTLCVDSFILEHLILIPIWALLTSGSMLNPSIKVIPAGYDLQKIYKRNQINL